MGVRVFIEPDGWTKEGQSQVVELKESLLWDGQQYMWSESHLHHMQTAEFDRPNMVLNMA